MFVAANSSILVENGHINYNLASNGGGIFAYADVLLTGGYVDHNYAVADKGTGHGGAAGVDAWEYTVTVDGGHVEFNKAYRYYAYDNIGGIYATTVNLKKGSVNDNQGGLTSALYSRYFNMSGGEIRRNCLTNEVYIVQGNRTYSRIIVNAERDFIVTGGILADNYIAADLKAHAESEIFRSSNIRITNATLDNNKALNAQGIGCIWATSSMYLQDVTITNSQCNWAPVVIYNGYSGSLKMVNVTIKNCQGNIGGAVFVNSNTNSASMYFTAERCNFINNVCIGAGGAIRTVTTTKQFTLIDTVITGNEARSNKYAHGGGIYAETFSGVPVQISGATKIYNNYVNLNDTKYTSDLALVDGNKIEIIGDLTSNYGSAWIGVNTTANNSEITTGENTATVLGSAAEANKYFFANIQTTDATQTGTIGWTNNQVTYSTTQPVTAKTAIEWYIGTTNNINNATKITDGTAAIKDYDPNASWYVLAAKSGTKQTVATTVKYNKGAAGAAAHDAGVYTFKVDGANYVNTTFTLTINPLIVHLNNPNDVVVKDKPYDVAKADVDVSKVTFTPPTGTNLTLKGVGDFITNQIGTGNCTVTLYFTGTGSNNYEPDTTTVFTTGTIVAGTSDASVKSLRVSIGDRNFASNSPMSFIYENYEVNTVNGNGETSGNVVNDCTLIYKKDDGTEIVFPASGNATLDSIENFPFTESGVYTFYFKYTDPVSKKIFYSDGIAFPMTWFKIDPNSFRVTLNKYHGTYYHSYFFMDIEILVGTAEGEKNFNKNNNGATYSRYITPGQTTMRIGCGGYFKDEAPIEYPADFHYYYIEPDHYEATYNAAAAGSVLTGTSLDSLKDFISVYAVNNNKSTTAIAKDGYTLHIGSTTGTDTDFSNYQAGTAVNVYVKITSTGEFTTAPISVQLDGKTLKSIRASINVPAGYVYYDSYGLSTLYLTTLTQQTAVTKVTAAACSWRRILLFWWRTGILTSI